MVIANKIDFKEELLEAEEDSKVSFGKTWTMTRKEIKEKIDSWNFNCEVFFTSARYQAYFDTVERAVERTVVLTI